MIIIVKSLIKKIAPEFVFNWYHWILAFLGAVVYGFPSKKLKVIGVTGTNGKSTVVSLASQILEEAGYKTAAISSIQFKIKDKTWSNELKMTMPGRFKIQKFMRQALKQDCQYLVLEVTSEGIKQSRHKFIDFKTAVLTNLTPEHIESHKGFENYRKAKGKLFQTIGPDGKIIVNLDDANADYFLGLGFGQKFGYGIRDCRVARSRSLLAMTICSEQIQLSRNGADFTINNTQFKTNLLGEFNVYNALAVIAIGLSENISLDAIKSALEKAKGIPGRLEIVIKEPFTVVVDYAHTPDALEKAYQAVKVFDGRIIGVLGAAGGGRDKWKRSELGRIAEKYCDKIIITNEDPYNEDPKTIIDEVAKGVKNKSVEKIIDRREAISKALQSAQKGDIVVITGKGCEPWMCVADNKKIPWDDREVVREEFEKIKT